MPHFFVEQWLKTNHMIVDKKINVKLIEVTLHLIFLVSSYLSFTESRNCCRACRLQKCIISGMKCPSKSEQPVSPPISDHHVSSENLNLNIELQPCLRKINDFIKIYYNSLRSIAACENPSSCFSANEVSP